VLNAVEPGTFSFEELERLIAREVARAVRVAHVPATFAYLCALLAGWIARDVVPTREEYEGLMSNLLAPDGPSIGKTRLSQWLAQDKGRSWPALCVGGGTSFCKGEIES
jgi:uncharacterized membrane protein YeaQ/YmgE (transglycosylase-associated protein family)